LIPDAAGNLYGTTFDGGASDAGVVFKLSPTGTETVLYSFTGGADGANPDAELIRDAAGNLYGTTRDGGTFDAGVVFELIRCDSEASGYEFKVLHTFAGGADDGAYLYAGLIQDAAGNLYGTTGGGGAASSACNSPDGRCGVVFKLSPGGTETILYRFTGVRDGADPSASLIRDAAGNLYGTTPFGGPGGHGVVFKVSPTGIETVLYSFTGGTDGGYPQAALIGGAAGTLYGTTVRGGVSNEGVVYKLIPCDSSYDFKVVYSFTGGADGGQPTAELIQDAADNLYGTTYSGGVLGAGVVFRLAP
jgi:uncharacterized repeat protein (TIGR03803 family)